MTLSEKVELLMKTRPFYFWFSSRMEAWCILFIAILSTDRKSSRHSIHTCRRKKVEAGDVIQLLECLSNMHECPELHKPEYWHTPIIAAHRRCSQKD